MRQVVTNLETGTTSVRVTPKVGLFGSEVLIGTSYSLLSAGTERMLVEFGRGNLVEKVRQQPDKVKQVLGKMRTDGVAATLDAVQSKLDQPVALGYCNVGTVLEVGANVTGFSVGDRVASNGKHAEIVAVPQNLCAKVPDDVDDESAAFTVLSAIAMQGVRLAAPTIGECVVVTGLGLIGLITVQILRAHGCRVLGIDTNASRLALARQFGAETVDIGKGEDPVDVAQRFSRGRGVDAVILTLATASSEPVSQAATMSRKRGRIVLVGVTGLELSRADFYEKELTFQVSCSYGPGRYDPQYEEKGIDYPLGFVRWTEQRNFEAVLDLMSSGALDMKPLISHRFDIDDAPKAYDLLASDEPSLGILLRYPPPANDAERDALLSRTVTLNPTPPAPGKASVGFIGAGNYGGRVLATAFRDAGATLHTVASSGGVSAVHTGRKYGFARATTDSDALIGNPAIDTIVISTRHDTHARFTELALSAGKHVFVEKPLCLTFDELERIQTLASADGAPLLMVGFNRRFAPHVVKTKELLRQVRAPKTFVMTVNAGAIPVDHWTQNTATGGGRLVGEACHFIDLLRHLAEAPIESFSVEAVDLPAGPARPDIATITLRFGEGSIGTIHYFANGNRGFPKERLEVFAGGKVLQLDNFRKLRGWGWKGFSSTSSWKQDKGQSACAAAFIRAVKDGSPAPIPLREVLEVSRVSIAVAEASVR